MVLNTPRRVGAALVNEYRDYENGVADVLAYLAGGSATVYRDVRLSGMRSGRKRQIDVLVRGRIFGSADVTMIVDCKRRKKPVDVKAIDSFIGMVGDVGAEVGMIVTSSGSTAAAQARAKAERGIQLEMLGLNELVQWSPPGTLGITYGVPTPRLAETEHALRRAGFRVTADPGLAPQEGECIVRVLRHLGERRPSGELQAEQLQAAQAALDGIGVPVRHIAHGVTMSGGTPAHRWLEVLACEIPTGLNVLAASEDEAKVQLDHLAASLAQSGISRSELSVRAPDGWPVVQMFGY
jgi:hypothetical protein